MDEEDRTPWKTTSRVNVTPGVSEVPYPQYSGINTRIDPHTTSKGTHA